MSATNDLLDVRLFVGDSVKRERRLRVLAAAEALTDELATDLVRRFAPEDGDVDTFVAALQLCDFSVARNNGEWSLDNSLRQSLLGELLLDNDLASATHSRLLNLATGRENGLPTEAIPTYLRGMAGQAYHVTFLDSDEGRRLYAQLAELPLSGEQWLAAQLATEQQELGAIEMDALEPRFLQGMLLYREGRIERAEAILRPIAETGALARPVAIAAHLIGRMDGRRFKTRRNGERLLRKSLELLGALDDQFGRAQVLHTLGQLLGRDPQGRGEAEQMLRESLELEREVGSQFGRAQVLHTLGQLLGRDSQGRGEAEQMLRESLELRAALDDQFGRAQVLHTLGQLLGRDSQGRGEAEQMLRESLELERELGSQFGRAQVLNSLGRLLADSGRFEEAVGFMRESLDLGRKMGRQRHQAMALYSLGQLEATRGHAEKALEYLRESLAINRSLRDRPAERLVKRAIERLER